MEAWTSYVSEHEDLLCVSCFITVFDVVLSSLNDRHFAKLAGLTRQSRDCTTSNTVLNLKTHRLAFISLELCFDFCVVSIISSKLSYRLLSNTYLQLLSLWFGNYNTLLFVWLTNNLRILNIICFLHSTIFDLFLNFS